MPDRARYERVFLVLGNHEFRGMDFSTGVSMARKLARDDLLDGRVAMLRCPLWSRIPAAFADVVRTRVNDFQKIAD
ncbi:hypothetical protein VUR80DRAFT_5204 [Thermomyces stellatus]